MFKKVLAVVVVAVFALVACSGHGLGGTWRHEYGGEIRFSGSNFAFYSDGVACDIDRGTFSVSGDRIEFVYASGMVEVWRFEIIQNTLWIEYFGNFTRKR